MRIVLGLLVEMGYCLFIILWAVVLSSLIFTLFHLPF